MPTVLDRTALTGAWKTDNNGGRKAVRLDNGEQYMVARSNTAYEVYRTTDNWATKTLVDSLSGYALMVDAALDTDGKNVFLIYCGTYTAGSGNYTTGVKIFTDGSPKYHGTLEYATLGGPVAVKVNEDRTAVHFGYSVTVPTQPSSTNVHYIRAGITSNGLLQWGTVEIISTLNNNGYGLSNLSIEVKDDIPYIISAFMNPGTNYWGVLCMTKAYTTKEVNFLGSVWGNKWVFSEPSNTYTKANPALLYVPKKINGLTNGRFWSTWVGKNAGDTNYFSLYVSYSDDGVTWSTPVILYQAASTPTFSQAMNPTITMNKVGDIFILFDYWNNSTYDIGMFVYRNGSWSSLTVLKDNTTNTMTYPSAILDTSYTIDITSPLLVYTGDSRIVFQGSWTKTQVIPTNEFYDNKDAFFEYYIDTDAPLTPITEKINGKDIRTWTPSSSGDETSISMTQEQWDAIKYGPYNALNVLPVSKNVADWEVGGYARAIGQTVAKNVSTTSLRHKVPIDVKGGVTYDVRVPTGTAVEVFDVDAAGYVLKSSYWNYEDFQYTTDANTSKLYVLFGRSNLQTITTAFFKPINEQVITPNTLTIEVGTNKWEFPFTKTLAWDAELKAVAKSAKDSNEVVLPAVKGELIATITSKGGTVSGDKWEDIDKAIEGITLGKKTATGSVLSPTSNTTIPNYGGSNTSVPYVDINMANIPFVPSRIDLFSSAKNQQGIGGNWYKDNYYYQNASYYGNSSAQGTAFRVPYTPGVMRIPVNVSSISYDWIAYE